MRRASKPSTEQEGAAREPAGGVAAVERALLIVSAIEASDTPSELSDIATRTGLYKSTILRLLGSLLGAGYVARLLTTWYRSWNASIPFAGFVPPKVTHW